MTQPWEKTQERYAESVKSGLRLAAVHRLLDQIGQSHLCTLFAWTSMHDLCIAQIPVGRSYNGPFLRVASRCERTVGIRAASSLYRSTSLVHAFECEVGLLKPVPITNFRPTIRHSAISRYPWFSGRSRLNSTLDASEDMKKKIGSIAWLLSLLVGVIVFSGWLSMVGNPHVAETMIGLVLAVVAGLVVYFKLERWSKGV